eukprot:TRINITY_DN31158_c0_g1_i1.p1 TRINITY_DN31158_c0_g1~~TRINITY_DN31158_c0_g1_i1.p1  ORF type:complete len:175 (-),score=37.21 TRINITY_DN31158_c0_g1_i1:37-561(-)
MKASMQTCLFQRRQKSPAKWLLLSLVFASTAGWRPCFAGLGCAARSRSLALQAVDYDAMTVADMKQLCKERGLPATGRKSVLLDRLKNLDSESGAAGGSDGKSKEKKAAHETKSTASPYLDDQGLLPDGRYMCMDGVARTGDWEKAKRENPDDLAWLTEWVVAARTEQLEDKKA